MSKRRRVFVGTTYAVVWLLCAVVIGTAIFFASSRQTTVASHDAVVHPTLTGQAVLRTGPVLPDLRLPSGSPLGVEITLGKTEVASTEALVERYALLASTPQGPIARVESAVRDMALDAALRGATLGVLPLLLWALVGSARRRELVRAAGTWRGGVLLLLLALVVAGTWAPWEPEEDTLEGRQEWIALQDFLGPEIPVPSEAADLEVLSGVTTSGARRLIQSAVDTYDSSLRFYETAEEAAAEIEVRRPEEGETVVLLVSDRHDNIGMDAVARAVADTAGAVEVMNAGDDTSTGSEWEAFSLDSLDAAFDDLDERWAVTGNHDNGPFVGEYLDDLGWTVLDGEVVEGPAGGRLLGVPDPRSSGLGTWRDESGLSFSEVGERLADEACAAQERGERINTLLVHDANLGSATLERGCADLVVGGHLHVQEGPDAVAGEYGEVGYQFTTGTTGGAAYAIALGSKLRRPAQVTLLTYDDEGRPVGLQPVVLQTNGRFDVGDYVELTYEAPDGAGAELDDEPASGPDGDIPDEQTDEQTDAPTDAPTP